MTALKPARKAGSHTATGRQLALTATGLNPYPAWPHDIVDLPADKRMRKRTMGWFVRFLRHRSPEGWQPADAGRVAMLARGMASWERETFLMMAGEGDAELADKLGNGVTRMSRQLGLTRVIRDPVLLVNDARVHAQAEGHVADLAGDDLLAKPRIN